MLELFEKAILTGMGALTLTQQKAEELAKELRERLDVSEEKGRELIERLEALARENQARLEQLAQEEVHKACDRMGVVTRDDFQKLEKKVQQLEKQLKALKA